MDFEYKKVIPHLLVVFGFVLASLLFFYPVLQGKVIYQSDIVQYSGMAKQQNDFRALNDGAEPYWMDNAFGGMPTYQVGAYYPNDVMKHLDRSIRFLPRPADYLFLYFIGIYVLFLVLRLEPKIAFLGALAFGFSTYLIIILGVGHNAKAHAIAYMPLVISGVLLCFRKQWLWGGILLALGMALELVANHFQMTYYLGLLLLVIGVVYLYKAFKNKALNDFFKSVGVMLIAVFVSLLMNSTHLLSTNEYTKYSTRGPSEITIQPDGSPKQAANSGLSYEYITEYSYGISESLNLLIPNFMGGSSSQSLDENAAIYAELIKLGASRKDALNFIERVPTYWGDQTFVAAPAYIGAGVFFLFLMAIFLVKGKSKYWLLGGTLLSLLLSWGDNFALLTKFFINYVPLYNKFRAVSSIQVILELCIPVLGILGLAKFMSPSVASVKKWNALKKSILILGGALLIILLFGGSMFSFSAAVDAQIVQQLGPNFLSALKDDRRALMRADTIRSLAVVLFVALLLYGFTKERLSKNALLIAVGIIVIADLVWIDRRYVNEANFVAKSIMEKTFSPNKADLEIMKDKERFRVLDLTSSPFNSARASYFHHSIGGYHAAKPQRIQHLFDYHMLRGNQEVFNMMNVKYDITQDDNGKILADLNPMANGNAWFVEKLNWVSDANEELLALTNVDTSSEAVIHDEFRGELDNVNFEISPQDEIKLESHQPNELVYSYANSSPKMAVFSEVYYPLGWNAYINGKLVPHYRVNYLLRSLLVPAGEGEIIFKFEPSVVQLGSTISLAGNAIFFGALFFALYLEIRKRKIQSIN